MFGIDDAMANVASLANTAIARIWPDATEVEKAKLAQISEDLNNAFQVQLQQILVDQEEAKSTSLFVSGWRPAVGWICALGYGYEYLLRPLVNGFGWREWPGIEIEALSTLLFGLLGLGVMRTAEKLKGVARK